MGEAARPVSGRRLIRRTRSSITFGSDLPGRIVATCGLDH